MFEDLRQAWKEAVDNFWRELEEETDETGIHGEARKQLSTMRRELGTAESELRRLQTDVARARTAAAGERGEEQTCLRRLAMAEGIGDAETAGIARTFAERAGERAAVMERKTEALEAELALRTRDLADMRAAVDTASAALGAGAQAGAAGVAAGQDASPDESTRLGDWPDPHDPADADRLQRDIEFRRMQREAREKAADARLEELKKRMQ